MRTGIPSVAYSSVARFTVLNYSNIIITHFKRNFKPMKNKIKKILNRILSVLIIPFALIIAIISVIKEELKYR